MTKEEKQIFKNLIDKWQDNRDYLLLFDSTESLYEAGGIYGCISDLKNAIAGLDSDLPLGGGEDYTSPRDEEVVEMSLCEVPHIMLRPDQLYRFAVMSDCQKCKDATEPYRTNTNDPRHEAGES